MYKERISTLITQQIITLVIALFFFVIAFALWLAKMVGAAWSFTIVGGATR